MLYVTYDLRSPGKSYEALWSRLTELGGKRILESVWALPERQPAYVLFPELERLIDANDRLLLITSAIISGTGKTLISSLPRE